MRSIESVREILILEDLEETRRWLADIATAAFDGARVTFAESVGEASRILRERTFDLALLDLGLDDGSGLEILELLASRAARPVCVVTTIFDDDRSLFGALRAGADGYLLKGRPPAELTAALRGILSGQPPLSPSIARRILAHFAPVERTDPKLTAREAEVLTLVAKGFTVAATAEALSLSPNTVAGYVKEIYRKLRVNSRAEAAIEAQRRGLV